MDHTTSNFDYDTLAALVRGGKIELFKSAIKTVTNTCLMNQLLQVAVNFGDVSITEALLENGADATYTKEYWTALSHAVEYEMVEIVSVLLIHGADPNVDNDKKDRDSLLHIATRNCNYEICKLLIEFGADVNVRNVYGEYAYHNAVQLTDRMVVKLFLERGIYVDLPDKLGRTPLHLASEEGDEELVTILIKYGANINFRDMWGKTPLHACNQSTRTFLLTHVIKLLLFRIYVCPTNLVILHQHMNDPAIVDAWSDCQSEFEKMSEPIVEDSFVTWLHLLYKPFRNAARYLFNEKLRESVESPNRRLQFPLLWGIVEKRITHCVEESILLQQGSNAISSITSNVKPLPSLCIRKILDHFNEKDLKSLVELKFICD